METIKLHKSEIYDGAYDVKLELMIHKRSPEITDGGRPAMLVFPGGGYEFTSDREAEPIASAYYSEGYNCFILRYTVGEKAKILNPLYDAAAAIAHIRENCISYQVNPDKICIIGFSAGGHLAGLLATQWHLPEISEKLGIESEQFKPNAAILGYPVITLTNTKAVPVHQKCFDVLLGEERDERLCKIGNLEQNVDERTCPCFIWSTVHDSAVPVSNSIDFARALTDKGIECELHIFPIGDHGLARANAETAPVWGRKEYTIPYVARWVDWSIKWLDQTLYNGEYFI